MNELGNIVILMPVYDDWSACGQVLGMLDETLARNSLTASVLIVDDGSTRRWPASFAGGPFQSLERVDVLRLRRNVGHQRAIALGLSYVEANMTCDTVVVMDADGEDDPRDVPRLIERRRQEPGEKIVFAERTRRSEGIVFCVGYLLFRALHWLLTGRGVRVGNFSAVPRERLAGLVVTPELWSHYAAAVFASRQPHCWTPTHRAKRVDGRSKMNFVALVTHGLTAISVFSDVIGVRMLLASTSLGVLAAAGILCVLAVKVLTPLAIPGWATFSAGLLLLVLLQSLVFAVLFSFVVLHGRNRAAFLPARDYEYFIDRRIALYASPAAEFVKA